MKLARLSLMILVSYSLMCLGMIQGEEKPQGGETTTVLQHKMKKLDGTETSLNNYKGKVLLLVNVASECGLTPQYEQLQQLHEKYNKQGLAVIGFPCNQFGGQEPGSADEIREFTRAW